MFSINNLLSIWTKCKKGKSNKKDILEFEYYLEDNIWGLYQELSSFSYKHSDYQNFCISDTKKRSINNAKMKDKIVHMILFRHLNDSLEKKFIHHLYSSRKNKGVHKMLVYINKCSQNVFYDRSCFILHLDVKKYFESVDHFILKKLLFPYLQTKELIYFADQIIDSFQYVEHKGIPLGNITSQLFANLYLSDLDWFIVKNLGCSMYARYNDDMFVVSGDREFLVGVSVSIQNWIYKNRLLLIPKEKTHLYKFITGVPVLGYKISPDKIWIKNVTKQNIFTKISDNNHHSYFGMLDWCKNSDLKDKSRSIFETQIDFDML